MTGATVDLSAGTIEYADSGGPGPVVVLIGGLAIGPSLWDGVVERLRDRHRVIVPTLPWGSHRIPMRPQADLTLAGQARLVNEFLAALDLRDVTLVESDSGMAQVLAGDRPERVGRLVICSCEAFENYPPGLPGKAVTLAARLPGGLLAATLPLRVRALRGTPTGYGWMARRPIPHAVTDAWLEPLFTQPAIRRDLAKYLRSTDRHALLDAAARLPRFERPVLIVWAAEDRVMPPEHGRRLAALFPDSRLVEVEDAYTLIPLDQPARLAIEIAAFIAGQPPAASAATS